MLVTDAGMLTWVKVGQPEKAKFPMIASLVSMSFNALVVIAFGSWLGIGGIALTTAGAVLLLLSLLGLTVYCGAFDIFGYSVSALGRRRYKSLYEYSEAHQEKRRRSGWTFGPLLLTGAAFLLAGLILWALQRPFPL